MRKRCDACGEEDTAVKWFWYRDLPNGGFEVDEGFPRPGGDGWEQRALPRWVSKPYQTIEDRIRAARTTSCVG